MFDPSLHALPASRLPATPRVVVIGAGMGGLAAAAELSAAGLAVTVLERAAAPGGKMREVTIGCARLDAGPTVFTMRWVFDALFARLGTTVDAHLTLHRAQVLARHAWGPGEHVDLHASVDASAEAISAFAGPAEAQRYRQFCDRAADVYRTLEGPFLRSQRPTPLSLVQRAGWRGLPGLVRISPFATLWSALGRHFHDPRLRQLFGRYATYCGASPWLAPATLMLVAHVEQSGVWHVEGGMHRVASVLAGLAARQGATLRYGCGVREILTGPRGVQAVQLDDGERLSADAVVYNGDTAALATGLLGADARRAAVDHGRSARSLSALTWNLVAPTTGFPLSRHNVFFGADYAGEFEDVFSRGVLPRDPTVYVCAQDRDDAGLAASGGPPERLLCLVNAPPRGDHRPLTPQELATCEERTFHRLESCGLQINRRAEQTIRTTPTDFQHLFPATGGALYGPASHGWMASFQRPGSRSRVPGLYLAGGSTHPGPGVPMAALSGHLAAQSLLQDLASTRRWHPVATLGGTSTPSATTANTA